MMWRPFSLGHRLRRAAMPATAAAAVLLASGCAGGGSATPAGGPTTGTGSPAAAGVVLSVAGGEYSFTPEALKVSAGPTTIRFTNKGAVEHDFVIKTLGVKLIAQPGKTAEATITLAPGTYQTDCSVPGHSQSGMHGTLVVS